MNTCIGEEILDWRRINLSKGGRRTDIDWLLDIEGDIGSSKLHKIILYPANSFEFKSSLEKLTEIWELHLNSKKPLQYIIGKCPWRDFVLEVNNDVLIPRQETELIVDIAINKIGKVPYGNWVDLGTGSGALAVALARSFPGWDGHASDCSESVLLVAKKNFNSLSPNSNITFHLGRWWEPLKQYKGIFDLVVSNPPYIPVHIFNKLDPIVRDFEPSLALCGGEDGFDCCKEVIAGSIIGLRSGGWLIFEHHYDQSEKARKLLVDFGFDQVAWENDLQGIRRFAICRKL